MRRAGLLFCADVDAPRYKVLKHRDQLPFVTSGHPDDTTDKWSDFTLDDAFRLRLMLDLIGNDGSQEYPHPGVTPTYAVTIIDNGLGKFEVSPLTSLKSNCWVAVVIFEAKELDENDKPLRFPSFYGGPINELGEWIAKQAENEQSVPVRVLTANASRAAAFVRQRAAELGLPEAEDFGKV